MGVETLRFANANIIGIVMNRVDTRKHSKAGHYGSYGNYVSYRYRYRYKKPGEADEDENGVETEQKSK